MSEVKVWSRNVRRTSYRLSSLSFHVIRPPHSWHTAFSKSDLETQRSRSWVRWTLKVTTWVQHSIDSHPFRSTSIGRPISEIRLFENLTLKIQGQGHGWGERWKWQHGSNIPSTHIPFIPCQSAMPFLRYDFFKIWPWNPKVKVMVEVKVENHKVGATSCRFTSFSFHVNRPSHSPHKWPVTRKMFPFDDVTMKKYSACKLVQRTKTVCGWEESASRSCLCCLMWFKTTQNCRFD